MPLVLRASMPTTIEIREDLPDDVGTVMADPDQIHQLVLNLGGNAAHAIPDGKGTFEVALQAADLGEAEAAELGTIAPGPCVRLTIKDSGEGMPPDVVARIFDPFFTTKAVGQGTGLGLSAVHGIVTSHGGAIRVDSHPGEGTGPKYRSSSPPGSIMVSNRRSATWPSVVS